MDEAPAGHDLLRVRRDDPDYQRLAAAESAFWGASQPLAFEASDVGLGDGPIQRYRNRRLTGDPGIPWQDTIAPYGPFRRGLFLGTSVLSIEARVLETNPALHGTFLDISEGALARRLESLAPRFPGRIDTVSVDLNFAELGVAEYDLIVSSSTLHHITNLEHVAHQANRALTADGYAFIHDFVGESRYRFSDQKKRMYETLYNRHIAKRSWRRPGVVWLDESDLSPFCGVRSADILPVLGAHLREEQVCTAGALTALMLRSRPVDWPGARPPRLLRLLARARRRIRQLRGLLPLPMSIDADLLHNLAFIGDLASDAGVITPGNAFGVYRKRA